MKTLLVTGANGLVGFSLCKILLSQNFRVIGTYRIQKEYICNLEEKSNFISYQTNLQDHRDLVENFKEYEIDCIFHTAARINLSSVDNYLSFFRDNVNSTINLLTAASALKIPKFVLSSSTSVYGLTHHKIIDESINPNPNTEYSWSKILAESVCDYFSLNFNIEIVILRYCGIYGKNRKHGLINNFVEQATDGKLLIVNENKIKDVISSKDAAYSNILAYNTNLGNSGPHIFNISSDHKLKISDIGNIIIDSLSSSSNISYSSETTLGSTFDIRKAKKVLKYEPLAFEDAFKQEFQSEKNI